MTRVVFMGTPDFAVPVLAMLLSEGYDVVGVLTRPDQPAGRGQQLEESPVKKLARANGLLVQQPGSLRDPQAQSELALLEPELIVVAAYGLILPQPVLDLPAHGALNVHGSLLPRWRGAAPIAAAILAGDAETGISIMKLEAGLDSGPVLSTAAITIAPDDTTGTLTPRLSALGAHLLAGTLPGWLSGEITPQPQDETLATYAPRILKDAGRIDWRQPAVAIERQIRAYHPWPSAFTFWRGQRLKIIRACAGAAPSLPGAAPGQVVHEGTDIGVATEDGTLWLQDVQLAGKRILSADIFVRGAPAFVGSTLPS